MIKSTDWTIVMATTLLALYVDLGILNRIIISVLPIESLMSIAYPLIILLLIVLSVAKPVPSYKVNKSALFIAVYLLIWYLLTIIIYQVPRVSILFFIVYTIFPLTIPSFIRIDGKLFVKEIMIIPFCGIFFLDNLLSQKTVDTAESGNLMGLSYTLLVPIVANILYLFSYFPKDDKKNKMPILFFSLPNIAYAMQLFQFGSRGPFFIVLFLPLVLFMLYRTERRKIIIKPIFVVLACLLFTIMHFYFFPILEFISNISQSVFHVRIEAVEKFLLYNEMGMIDNGRDYIAKTAVQSICENPWGYGLDQFYNNTGMIYPHNFILQILYDSGIILGSLFIILLISKTIEKWKNYRFNEFSVFLLLFFISVPSALVSHDLWEIGTLWLLFGLLFSKNFVVN